MRGFHHFRYPAAESWALVPNSIFVRQRRLAPISGERRLWLAPDSDIETDGTVACYLFRRADRSYGFAGYALRPSSLGVEILSLFNAESKRAGLGRAALRDAISRGGEYLDCFEGLVSYYEASGFVETHRVSFDWSLAPKGWQESYGTPDVVTLRHKDVFDFTTAERRGAEAFRARGE